MENIIRFLIEAGKLKRIKRTGWVLRGVKNPETIADHTFRMTLMAWVLGDRSGLNFNKILKIALIHDLCEVYAGDITPYSGLPSDKKIASKDVLAKIPRLSKSSKEKRIKEKHEKERASLKKVLINLPESTQNEIMSLWLDYENGATKEGRFVKQVDRVENLLQALEYWEKDKNFPIEPWWVQLKELVDDPSLLIFLKSLDLHFQKEYNSASQYGHSRIEPSKKK
ncbi:MAG: HD domain-containing protein [bacterium]|nr:HD domain-containing protein [bacterium]